jgi:hypothetical protein
LDTYLKFSWKILINNTEVTGGKEDTERGWEE